MPRPLDVSSPSRKRPQGQRLQRTSDNGFVAQPFPSLVVEAKQPNKPKSKEHKGGGSNTHRSRPGGV